MDTIKNINAGRAENVIADGGSFIFPFYIAPFEDSFFDSKLISGNMDSGMEVYFELELELNENVWKNVLNTRGGDAPYTENDAAKFMTDTKDKALDCIYAHILMGDPISFYDPNSYRDIACAARTPQLVRNTKNIFTYTQLSTYCQELLANSSNGGSINIGYSRICFYLDTNRYASMFAELGFANYDLSFVYHIKIKNLYMQKLVIPYIEPPRVDPTNTKSYINDNILDMKQVLTVSNRNEIVLTGVSTTSTDSYGTKITLDAYKFKPTLRDDLDPLKNYLGPVIDGPHNLRCMNPELATPTGCSLGTFKVVINKFFYNMTPFLVDVLYSDSPSNYGLETVPIGAKMNRPSNNFLGCVTYVRKSDLLAKGLTEEEITSRNSEKFNLLHKDGTTEEVYRFDVWYPDGGMSGGNYRYLGNDDGVINSSSTLLDMLFHHDPEATIDLYCIPYVSYFNKYVSKSAPIGSWGTIQYTPNADAMNIMDVVVGVQIHTNTSRAFKVSDKMDTILELPSVQEIAYLQVGAYNEYGDSGEYACYRIYASKDGKIWDYLGDSIGLSKTSESNEFYQYLSIDISNIAEPDSTKTYSKIKGKVLKVTIPDNNMYLRNTTTGAVTNIAGSKEFAIRDIVINNAGTILDFTLSGLTKLTYNNEVFEGAAADTKFTQLLKDTDFVNIDFSNLKAEGSEILIDLGSEKEFDTVNIITGKTVTGGIHEMKYSVTISSDGSSFTDVISMDPAAFTEEMFLKRSGMLVMNNNCFFVDNTDSSTTPTPVPQT